MPRTPDVPDHLVGAILSTLLCCLPLGIVAIVYAVQARSLVDQRQWERARHAAESARTWTIGAVAGGLGVAALGLLVSVAGR